MNKKLSRSALKKFLGVEKMYEATFEKMGDETNALLLDVKHKNKVVADHVWVSNADELGVFEKGDQLSFLATAHSYKDSHGCRKYGLRRCYRFRTEQKALDQVVHDNRHKRFRLHKK